ncbi:MAG: shikimate dehydrogenase [Rhodobacteraceae bacterium]|nr:shikimate dehydrogenase [Paracoccaceae bacterium]
MSTTLPLAGVIGFPIAHSKSPKMHGLWLAQNGIKGHYVPLAVSPDDFEQVLKLLPKMGFVGANVTIPHKVTALQLATHATDRARQIGAANTITFGENGEIYADNTDGHGFITNIKSKYPDWSASTGPLLVLGAGGAARAVLSALLDDGAPQILIANRTRENADRLARDFGESVTVIEWSDVSTQIANVATLVNTTSLGMVGKPPMTIDLSQLQPETLVSDIVYTPLETDLLKTASDKGCKTVDGLGMLIYQGMPGFEKWFGATPVATDELREMLLK